MDSDERLLGSLKDVKELQAFLHDLFIDLARRRAKPAEGEDVTNELERQGRAIPEALRGMELKWDSHHDFTGDDLAEGSLLVLVAPGHPDALGFTIGCVRIGRLKICLECGWLYCRIVIKGRF
jgi:hypothetical protein